MCSPNKLIITDPIQWKLEQGFKKINMWSLVQAACFIFFWPHYLNVKDYPVGLKKNVDVSTKTVFRNKIGNLVFQLAQRKSYVWTMACWIWYKTFRWYPEFYGKWRLSIRLPDERIFILCDEQRGISFAETFEMKDISQDVWQLTSWL